MTAMMIFTITAVLILLIQFIVMRSNAKPRKNIILGVTIPYTEFENPEVSVIIKEYKRALSVCFIISLLTIATFFISDYFSVNATIFFVWIVLMLLAYTLIWVKYNKKLKELKVKKNWGGVKKTIIDTKVTMEIGVNLSVWWFLLPFAIALIPVVLVFVNGRGAMEALIYIIMSGTVLLFMGMFALLKRQRAEIVGSNTSVNALLTKVRKKYFAYMCFVSAVMTGFFSVFIWFSIENSFLGIIGGGIFAALIIIFAMYTEFKARSEQRKISEKSGAEIYADEDDNWIFGMFYHNPQDNHIMKNERVGTGMTVNLAKPGGKIAAALSVLLIMLLPLMGVLIMQQEFTPISLSFEGDVLVSTHVGEEYRIKLEDIEDIEILDKLPMASRIVGTGMENLQKGLFSVEGYGRCEICVNSKNPPFVVVKTEGTTYILGAQSGDEAQLVYNKVTEAVK